MKVTIDPPKRSNYFDIKLNGIGGRDDSAQKQLVVGSIMDSMARRSRKTKVVRHGYSD